MSPVEAAHFKIWNPIDFHYKALVRNCWYLRFSQKLLKFLEGVERIRTDANLLLHLDASDLNW